MIISNIIPSSINPTSINPSNINPTSIINFLNTIERRNIQGNIKYEYDYLYECIKHIPLVDICKKISDHVYTLLLEFYKCFFEYNYFNDTILYHAHTILVKISAINKLLNDYYSIKLIHQIDDNIKILIKYSYNLDQEVVNHIFTYSLRIN